MKAWRELYEILEHMRSEMQSHPNFFAQITPQRVTDMIFLMHEIKDECFDRPKCETGDVINFGDVLIGEHNTPITVSIIEYQDANEGPVVFGPAIDGSGWDRATFNKNTNGFKRYNEDCLENVKSDMELSPMSYCHKFNVTADNAFEAERYKTQDLQKRMDMLWAQGQR